MDNAASDSISVKLQKRGDEETNYLVEAMNANTVTLLEAWSMQTGNKSPDE